jgi:hypothetical protein
MAVTGTSPIERNGVAHAAAAAAIVLTVVLYVWPLTLGAPIIDPDEGLHAAIAQEMLDRGDAVMPRFLGEPFLDKPILYFWALMASLRAFGASELAVRLPGLLFGWLGALTTALLAWQMAGGAPRRSPCLTPRRSPLGLSQVGATSRSCRGSPSRLFRARGPERRRRGMLGRACWRLVGLAMTKGLVGWRSSACLCGVSSSNAA